MFFAPLNSFIIFRGVLIALIRRYSISLYPDTRAVISENISSYLVAGCCVLGSGGVSKSHLVLINFSTTWRYPLSIRIYLLALMLLIFCCKMRTGSLIFEFISLICLSIGKLSYALHSISFSFYGISLISSSICFNKSTVWFSFPFSPKRPKKDRTPLCAGIFYIIITSR